MLFESDGRTLVGIELSQTLSGQLKRRRKNILSFLILIGTFLLSFYPRSNLISFRLFRKGGWCLWAGGCKSCKLKRRRGGVRWNSKKLGILINGSKFKHPFRLRKYVSPSCSMSKLMNRHFLSGRTISSYPEKSIRDQGKGHLTPA